MGQLRALKSCWLAETHHNLKSLLSDTLTDACQPTFVQSPRDLPTHSAEPPTHVLLLQVYSPEVLRAFGKALVGLLRDTSIYMQAMQAADLPLDTGEWLPRLVFLLLQNPLNGMIRLLSHHAGDVVAAETRAAMPRTCMHSEA